MSLIATVTVDGLNVRAKPLPKAELIDTLAKGEQLEIDETTAPVNGWSFGRVSKVQNNLEIAPGRKRTDQRGWFYTRGTVNVHHAPERIDPEVAEFPRLPHWLPLLVAALVAAVVGIAFLAIYG